MALPAVVSLARSAPPTIDPAATPKDPALRGIRGRREADEEPEPGITLALGRVSPQGRANNSSVVWIDVGSELQNFVCG